jgi:hypothetical protein
MFARTDVYKAHIIKCQVAKSPVKEKRRRIKCGFKNCSETFRYKLDLIKHLKATHDRAIEPPQVLTFPCYKEFKRWKNIVEDSSWSYFSKQFGVKNGRQYFYCQHDGRLHSHRSKHEPARKTDRKPCKGTIKRNFVCTAMMTVRTLKDGTVNVHYYPTHLHVCRPQDLKFQPLTEQTYDFIDQQLAWSVPPRQIALNLRDDTYKRNNRNKTFHLKRNNLVKVRTIRERKRRRAMSTRLHQDDATALKMMIEALKEDVDNPVLLYKPFGSITEVGPPGSEDLPLEVFLLVLQTGAQRDMLKEGSKTALVIDETHGTNQYDFRLLNAVVKDEFNLGYPVLHAISSKSDEAVLQFVFQAVKEKCPDLEINCCVTDDDPALINALNRGLKAKIWHILCKWHIHRTIQQNLHSKVRDAEMEKEMYQIMSVIIDAVTEKELYDLIEAFEEEYEKPASKFFEYFHTTLLPKISKWAMCYRTNPHGGIDTTMLVESFHNILKTVYLQRKPNKRLDELVGLLLQIEEDYFLRRQNALALGCMSAEQVKEVSSRHERGLKILDEDVTELISGHRWQVKSQVKNSSEIYDVEKSSSVCDAPLCVFVCASEGCHNLCSHLYLCNCPDEKPLCKHIHKIHAMAMLSSSQEESCGQDLLQENEPDPEYHTVDVEVNISNVQGQRVQDTRITDKISSVRELWQKIDKDIETSPVKNVLLSKIHGILSDISLQCCALSSVEMQKLPEMEVKRKITSTEKLKCQVLPFKKVKKAKKKRAFERPGSKCRNEITEFLMPKEKDNDESVMIADENCLNSELTSMEGNVVEEVSVVSSFGPPITHSLPNETILAVHGLHITLAHLKSLDNNLNSQEIEFLQKHDPFFRPLWLYDEVINAFLKETLVLCKNESMYACDTTVALKLLNGSDFKNFLTMLSTKSVVLFPANIGSHWVATAVLVSSSQILYYNPIAEDGSVLFPQERKLLEGVIKAFPFKKWSVKRHYDQQSDASSCGVYVCWFGEQILKGNIPPVGMVDPAAFRLAIYNTIRQHCLCDGSISLDSCRICARNSCSSSDVKCAKCKQSFHRDCLMELQTSGLIITDPFSCPQI